MRMPNVIHPVAFDHKGAHFQVVTYRPVSTEDAATILALFFQVRVVKPQRGRTYQVCYDDERGAFF